jgi:predicted RNase H-like HicB family nuclease
LGWSTKTRTATTASPSRIFPGVVTAGTSLDDARAVAEEALAFHIEGLVADGEAIPHPSSLEKVMTAPENRDGVAILVPAKSA